MKKLILILSLILITILFSCKKEVDRFCWVCQTTEDGFKSEKTIIKEITYCDKTIQEIEIIEENGTYPWDFFTLIDGRTIVIYYDTKCNLKTNN